jgi:hypothetical protein
MTSIVRDLCSLPVQLTLVTSSKVISNMKEMNQAIKGSALMTLGEMYQKSEEHPNLHLSESILAMGLAVSVGFACTEQVLNVAKLTIDQASATLVQHNLRGHLPLPVEAQYKVILR